MSVRIIVCGSHKRGDRDAVFEKLDHLHARRSIAYLVQGGAAFIDRFAKEWAEERGIPNEEYRAEWTKYGKSAGPMRNRRMLEEVRPDGVVAFPGNRGTSNMIAQAELAGIPVWLPMKETK